MKQRLIKYNLDYCWLCPHCIHPEDSEQSYICEETGKNMTDEESDTFPDWCPLEEIEGEFLIPIMN